MSVTTCVTAIYDIGREKIDGRSIGSYKEWLLKTVSSINEPFIIFLDSTLSWEDELYAAREGVGETVILSEPLSAMGMWKYRDQVERILNNMNFKRRQGNPKDITNLTPDYTLVNFNKFFWLEKAITMNPFQSSQFLWIDAGYSRFFPTDRCYRIVKKVDSFYIESNPSIKNIEKNTHDNTIGTNQTHFKGGLFLTDIPSLHKVKKLALDLWENEMLNKTRIDNEQIAITLLAKEHTSLIKHITSEGETSLFRDIFCQPA